MKIKPLADRVLIRAAAAEEKTVSGIIIPDTAKEKPLKGEVIATGDGTKDEKGTSSLEQTKGAFHILFSAFRKMKDLGIYKDAAIIITADHGSAVSDTDPLQKATRIGLFYKPAGSADTPLKTSHAPVSLKNIPATIAKSSGLDTKKYGKAIDEVGENENVTRFFYKGVINDYGTEIKAYKYEINGDAGDFNNWKIISEKKVKESHSFY